MLYKYTEFTWEGFNEPPLEVYFCEFAKSLKAQVHCITVTNFH